MNAHAPRLRVLSLGAGVQSTTLALMASRGDIGPMPDCAIFADTGWEPKAVYAHLERLRAALPFPVHTVSGGNLREDAIAGGSERAKRFAAIPWFIVNKDGSHGMGRRQCTAHYKLEPIRRKVVELCDGKRRPSQCEMWIGISTDEIQRMKDSRVKYIKNRWPLIERGTSRENCKKYLASIGWDAPRSACIGCPFHKDDEWRRLTREEMADARTVDRAIRHQRKMNGVQFMHRKRVPLDEVDFSTAAERGQIEFGFLQECEGMCGV